MPFKPDDPNTPDVIPAVAVERICGQLEGLLEAYNMERWQALTLLTQSMIRIAAIESRFDNISTLALMEALVQKFAEQVGNNFPQLREQARHIVVPFTAGAKSE